MLGDSFIQGFMDRLKIIVLFFKVCSIFFQYYCVFCKWKEFVVCKFNEICFFVDFFYVVFYLQYFIEQVQFFSVIDFVFYGIKWVYDMVGVLFLIDNFVVENVRLVVKRIFGIVVVNCKEFIFLDLICKIVSQVNLDNFVDLCNVIMYVFCFIGFFRFDDIFRVRRSDIFFYEGFMVI